MRWRGSWLGGLRESLDWGNDFFLHKCSSSAVMKMEGKMHGWLTENWRGIQWSEAFMNSEHHGIVILHYNSN